jgi:outer membrane autotransporter protein
MHRTHPKQAQNTGRRRHGAQAANFFKMRCTAALLALLFASPSFAAEAYDPLLEITAAGSGIQAGGWYPELFRMDFQTIDEIGAYLKSEYGLSDEKTAFFLDWLRAGKGIPDGIDFTVNGAVNLAGDENYYSVTRFDTSGTVRFNGGITSEDTELTVEAKRIEINGSFRQTGLETKLHAASSVSIAGDIEASGRSLRINAPDSIVITGDIRVSGDKAGGKDVPHFYSMDEEVMKAGLAALPVPKTGAYQMLVKSGYGTLLRIGNASEGELAYGYDTVQKAPAYIRVEGNITVENGADTANSVRLALTGNGTDWSWKGAGVLKGAGSLESSLNERGIFVYAYDGAVWAVQGVENTVYSGYGKTSEISAWVSYGPTVIDLTETRDTVRLYIDELKGEGTVIREKVDPNHTADGNLTDMVVLGGRSSGTHTVELHSTGAEPMEITTGRIPYLQVIKPCRTGFSVKAAKVEGTQGTFLTGYDEEIGTALKLSTEDASDGAGKVARIQMDGAQYFTFTNEGIRMIGEAESFVLTQDFPVLTINYGNVSNELDVGNRKYRILDPVVEADGTVKFYLEMEGVLPDGTPVPTSDLPFNELSTGAELVTTLAGDGAVYSAWMADLSDLRKRLGEVRYGAQDGLWAKGIAQKDRIDGLTGANFKQKLYGLQLGLDHIVTQDEDRMWLLGANFKYNTVDQKVDAMRYGKGDLKTYGAFLYATYADYKGWYTDLVLSLDHYKQKMTAEQTDSSYVHGRYSTWGWGASVEVGRMFSSAQDDEGWGPWYSHWWIEPQAQLAYYWVNGKKFSMDNGMTVQQKNGDSLIGRLGVVIGKKFNYGKNRKEVDKRYSQFYLKGGVKHEFLGGQTVRVNNDTFNGKLRGTRVYYGAGFDWNMTDQLRLYAQVERESGSKYRKDYEVSVGLKWQF